MLVKLGSSIFFYFFLFPFFFFFFSFSVRTMASSLTNVLKATGRNFNKTFCCANIRETDFLLKFLEPRFLKEKEIWKKLESLHYEAVF